jgi:hypothetical protein
MWTASTAEDKDLRENTPLPGERVNECAVSLEEKKG